MKTYKRQRDTQTQRKNLFKGLVVGMCLSFVMYAFGIVDTTLSIADAKTSNRDITELQTEIAELEIAYFDMINTLSLDQALAYDMSEQQHVVYARVDQTTTVAYNH